MIKSTKISNINKYYAFCAALVLFNSFIDYFVSMVLRLLSVPNDNLRVIVYVIYILAAASAIVLNFKNFTIKSLILPALLFFAFALSYNYNGEVIENYSDQYLYMFFICFPAYLLFRNYTNLNEDHGYLYKMVLFFSYLSGTFFAVIFTVNYFIFPILNSANYQTTSYALLLPTIFLFSKKEKKLYDVVLLAILLILSLLAGGRASLFCLLIYFIVLLIRKGKDKPLYFVWLVVLGVVGFLLSNYILSFIADICTALGIKGGIASYSGKGNVYTDNRTALYNYCFELARKNNFLGYGMLGERYDVYQIGQLYQMPYQVYEHNLFLEILLQYGWVVTLLFTVWFILKIYSFFKTNKNNYKNKAVFDGIFFSTGFLVLMFSTTYFTRPDFFALLGLIGLYPICFVKKEHTIERQFVQKKQTAK